MAGETAKTSALCLRIAPWSRTSHVVTWLTPSGRLTTSVKGAVRPKSAFLGQYDLNYSCELVYYLHGHENLHALRECVPVHRRDTLRENYRALLLAERFRHLVNELAPTGPDAADWMALLSAALDELARKPSQTPATRLAQLVHFEMRILELSGLAPDLTCAEGGFILRGERRIPVSSAVARCLEAPFQEKNFEILLDAARVIGVFYNFHLDVDVEGRRELINLISQSEKQK